MEQTKRYQEIERKYLVKELPELTGLPAVQMLQGYLKVSGAQVRLRREGERHLLTVKGGHGLTRTEVELPLETAQFTALWPLTQGRRVEKRRTRVKVVGGIAELDEFRGQLEGLMLVEVEFDNATEAEAFQPPVWFGQEVTNDAQYSNHVLSELQFVPGVGCVPSAAHS